MEAVCVFRLMILSWVWFQLRPKYTVCRPVTQLALEVKSQRFWIAAGIGEVAGRPDRETLVEVVIGGAEVDTRKGADPPEVDADIGGRKRLSAGGEGPHANEAGPILPGEARLNDGGVIERDDLRAGLEALLQAVHGGRAVGVGGRGVLLEILEREAIPIREVVIEVAAENVRFGRAWPSGEGGVITELLGDGRIGDVRSRDEVLASNLHAHDLQGDRMDFGGAGGDAETLVRN